MLRGLISAAFCLGLLLPAGAGARCADWTPQPKPQNASRDIVGLDLDMILDRGWIEFAVYDAFPPYSFEEAGKPAGIDIEIGKLIAKSLGVKARFKLVSADENLEADLRNTLWKGPIVGGAVSNVMLRVPYDSAFTCRVEQVVFTGQYATEGIAIAYNKDAYPDEKPVPAYFRFDTVAVENDSIADFYLTSLAGGQLNRNIRRFPTMALAMDALAAGEVMAAMGPKGQLEYGLTDALDLHQPPLPGFAVGTWTVGLGVNFRYRPLAYAVDDAIYAALEDGRMEAIFASFGLSFTPPER